MMFDGSTPAEPSLLSALKASGLVGLWETNVPAGRTVLDEGAARVMAGDPSLAGQPIVVDQALARIHPEDRSWVFERIGGVRRTGGAFAADFRILTETGEIRWIRNRGHLGHTQRGLHGYGTYSDITDTRPNFAVLSGPPLRAVPEPDPLEAAAAHALATREAIDRTEHPTLRPLIDVLLWEMGRAIARRRAG